MSPALFVNATCFPSDLLHTPVFQMIYKAMCDVEVVYIVAISTLSR